MKRETVATGLPDAVRQWGRHPAFELLGLPAWVTDSEGIDILAFNAEAKRTYCTGDALAGSIRVAEIVTDWSSSRLKQWSGSGGGKMRQGHRLQDGRVVDVSVAINCLTIEEEAALYWVVVAQIPNYSADSPRVVDHSTDCSVASPKTQQDRWLQLGLPAAFADAPFAIAVCKFDTGQWVQCNQAMRDLVGIAEDDWFGKTSVELDLWEDPLIRGRMMRQLVDESALTASPAKLLHRKGHVVEVVVTGCTFTTGGVKYTFALYHDSTESMARLRASEANEALLSRALQGAASAVWEWDLKTDTYQYVERWEKLLGYQPGELPHNSSSLNYLLHPDDAAIVASRLDAHFKDFNPFTIEARLRTKSGAYRWFFVRGQAVKDESGRAVRMSGTIDDCTEKRLQEAERTRVNERLALATSAVGLGTWEVYPDGSAVWDAQTYRLYGRDPATAVLPETICRESVGPVQWEAVQRWLIETLQRKSFTSFEFSVLWPDGQLRWIAAKGKSIKEARGRPVSLIGVNWDITDQRRAAAALQAHQQELSSLNHRLMEQEKEISKALAYSLHDQLGQTLTALRLGIDTMRLRRGTDRSFTRQCELLELLVGKAMQEVREALGYLRPPMLDELGLGRALESELLAVPMLSTSTKMALIADQSALEYRWPAAVEYACFMIAREAITNALKHAKCQKIEVVLDCSDGTLSITIRDNGVGISTPVFELRPGHLGLLSMRERAQAIDAKLKIDSLPFAGTQVTIEWSKS